MPKDTNPCCRNCGGQGSVVVRQANTRTGTYTLTTVTCRACGGTGTAAR